MNFQGIKSLMVAEQIKEKGRGWKWYKKRWGKRSRPAAVGSSKFVGGPRTREH